MVIALSAGLLTVVLRLDARMWRAKYERDEHKRRDRIDTQLDDLHRLEQWRAALRRQHENSNIRIGKYPTGRNNHE